MGRGKKKRKARQKIKRAKKIKGGKLVRFCLANSGKKYPGFSNKYCYQANIHNLIYKDSSFENVKFQNSNITECNFRNSKLTGIDFYNSNLKKSKFSNAVLKDVIFFNCNLKGTDFKDTSFKNVFFISSNISLCKNLNKENITITTKYPKITNQDLVNTILELAEFKDLYKFNVLHVKKNKINNWNVNILYSKYLNNLSRTLQVLKKRKNKKNFITLYSYKKFIERYLKI
ncbi:pentapeptide repeat-containing protein [Fusobacterium sp. HC1336]|uniref:pentapeptide repeat-containing protein n=1 Tax=Fusobacterium sp. HC1336 TaxID=3171169 RepID=UPI003F21FA17